MTLDIVHVAKLIDGRNVHTLFLRKTGAETYKWFMEDTPTDVKGITPEEAIRLAKRHWTLQPLVFLDCGKRFTLPERDEHGTHALFQQMAASYSSFNGIYYDEELGHSCIVKEASQEAVELLSQLTKNR